MASQLSLRIATLFDRKGFDDFNREIKDFSNRIRETRTFAQELGQALVGAFSVNEIRRFAQAAIEEERTLTILANRLDLLGESGRESAALLGQASRDLALSTRFTQTESLNALNVILRTSTSSTEALRQLSVAQDIAAATGQNLTTVSLALSRAQAGSTFFLQRITGLTREQIREMEKQGNLIESLGRRFQGFASRDAQTLGGQLDILRNKFQGITQSIGEDLLPIVQGFINLINKVPEPLLKTTIEIGAIVTAINGMATATSLVTRVFGTVGGAATKTAQAAQVASQALSRAEAEAILFGAGMTAAAGQATAAASNISSVGGALAVLLRTLANPLFQVALLAIAATARAAFSTVDDVIKENISSLDEETARLNNVRRAIQIAAGEGREQFSSFEQAVRDTRQAIVEVNQQLGSLPEGARGGLLERRQELRRQLTELENAKNAQGRIEEVSADKELQRERELTQTKESIRRVDLANEIVRIQTVLSQTAVSVEEREALERRLANNITELNQRLTDDVVNDQKIRLDRLRSQIEAFKTLRLPPLSEAEAQAPDVLNRRLQDVRKLANAERERIETNLNLELRAIEIARQRGTITDEQATQRRVQAQTEAAQEAAEVLQRGLEEARPIEETLGSARSIRSVVDDFSRQLQAAAEQNSIALDLQVRFGDDQINRVVRAVERGLRQLDIDVEAAAHRQAIAESGAQ